MYTFRSEFSTRLFCIEVAGGTINVKFHTKLYTTSVWSENV